MTKYHTVTDKREWKGEEFDALKPTVYDWCRMAAFIDGEGNLQVNPYKKTRRTIVRIVIANTNPSLPAWLMDTFGGNTVIKIHDNPKWKPAYIWSCTAARAAWIMTNCMPWFVMKSEQAKLLIRLQENIDKTRQGRGRSVSEEDYSFRASIHEQVKRLNRKGPSVEIPITSEE